MTTRVMGLDLSLERTGVAGPVPGTHRSICPQATTGGRRLSEIVRRLDAYMGLGVDLAVIERPTVGRGGVKTMEVLAELQGAVKARLFEQGAEVALVVGSTLKKYATGNGSCSKDDMLAAAQECGAQVSNHDEADAFWLQAMGRQWADGVEPAYQREQLREARRQAVKVVKWPQLALRAGA